MRPRQTSRTPRKRHKNRIFWLSTTILVLFVVSVFGLKASIPVALAMEQQTRCGLEEHVHDEDCYIDNVIICQEKAHSHSNNCYLLLLEDNDINMLLTAVSQAEDKNLESLIAGVLGEAVRLNNMSAGEDIVDISDSAVPLSSTSGVSDSAVMTASFSGTTYAGTEVSQLNNIIDTFALEPAMVLNEGLAVPMAVDTDGNGNGGVMVAAEPSTDDYKANIYLYVDEKWQCVDVLTYNKNGSDTSRSIPIETFLNALNAKVTPDLTRDDFSMFYSENSSFDLYSASTPNAAITNYLFGGYGHNTTPPLYVRLYVSGTQQYGVMDSAALDFFTVTKVYPNNAKVIEFVRSGMTITLENDYIWSTTANGPEVTSLIQTVNATSKKTFYARPKAFDVDIYVNDVKDEAKSLKNQTGEVNINLGTLYPGSNYIWCDKDGNPITNLIQTVSQETAFYAYTAPAETITIDYDVNFSTSGYSYIKSLTDTEPALLGQDMVSVAEGEEVLVNDVTDRNVTIELSTGAARYGTVHFLGWKVGDTDTIIKPSSVLTWNELKEYAVDGKVTLTGQWDFHMFQSANFFMSYRQDGGTSSDKWTPVIFNTYVGGVDLSGYEESLYNNSSYNNSYCDTVNEKYGINYAENRDMNNHALYDKQIRELHGESSSGAWFSEFPTDKYIFEALKKETDKLYVDGEQVKAEDLDENHYTIRWIAFKAVPERRADTPMSWHIDGVLVKKPGAFEITKTFAGNQMLIDAAKNGFSIQATNGKVTHTFHLDDAISSENGVYKWKVEDVKYNEVWTITESPPNVSDALSYHEWTVVDPYNTQNTAGTGKTVTIRGVTYPVDVQIAHLMQVNFNNIYYQKDSLMLKKEDEKTGQALRGAEFELWQNGSRMTFDYNATTGLYEYNQNGNGASRRLSSDTANGYINISTTGFSYENGEVTVKEVKTPAGYGAIDDIVLGKGGNGVIGILSDSNDYARYNDGLLIIQNSSDPIDVTVKKEWKNYANTEKLPVIVQLLANGDNALASELIGITGSASVTLDGTNSYMHTWYGLPVYANGEVINWSVREIQIGDEKCKTDYSFANWIPAVSKTTDKNDADKDTVLLTVTNMPKTVAILMLTKTDWDGTTFLPDTEFTLKNMNNGATTTLTTDAAGKLTFHNLKYETRYELTETKAPDGYWKLSEPVYFTIVGDGKIQIEQGSASEYVTSDSTYSLHVKNRSAMPMPETGGIGTLLFTGFGMLMLFGVFTYQKKNAKRKRRRGARRTSR